MVTPRKMCICMHPKDLNQVIKWEHYPSLTVEEVVPRMPNVKYFPPLDANQGFWQMKLEDNSLTLLIPAVEIPAFTDGHLFSARGVFRRIDDISVIPTLRESSSSVTVALNTWHS